MIEDLDGLRNAFLHLLVIAYVAVHAIHAFVSVIYLFHGVVFDVEDDDLGAFLHELLGHTAAKAVGATGYDCDFVDEPLLFHMRFLSRQATTCRRLPNEDTSSLHHRRTGTPH